MYIIAHLIACNVTTAEGNQTASMQSTIETLPLSVSERICEYLDDESTTRQSLQAFVLTNKGCHTAAKAQRFQQIQLRIGDPNELESSLRRLGEFLAGGRHRHVRRLKISREGSAPRQDENIDEDGCRNRHRGWNVRPFFHMHDFCRPSEASIHGWEGYNLAEHPEN